MTRFFKKVTFPVMERYSHTCIQRHLDFIKTTQWWSAEDLEKLQLKKLRAMIIHSYENVPYYHRLFRENNLQPDDIKCKLDLKKIPVLSKDIIRKNQNDLLAQNISSSKIMKTYSSGSTGEPFSYFLDLNSYSAGWAQTFRCWGWGGYEIGDHYVKISLNPRTSAHKKMQDLLLKTKYVYALQLNEETILEEIEKIRKFRPKIIRGYASHLYAIAKLMEKSDIEYSGASITTTGDMLFPHYRDAIERQFNCRVFDAYGGEGTPVSFECEEHRGYHISDEDVIVEFLREGSEVSTGETGNITFTNLNNYAMPFIRYEINDLGKPSDEKCSCGRCLSMMEQIEGRDSDIIITPRGDIFVVHFFTIFFEYIEGVDQFQVIQEEKNKILIKLKKNEHFNDSDYYLIKERLQEKMGDDMEIIIDVVDEIPLSGRSGKRRFVISKVPLKL
ncbi:phenylacetate--CoA ligase family protein [Methanoplanus sp. FWC-SCC4]|uniref:Phenylacetate--CoA ligase family protein n=1 Tax=Methanochimaera problematica TaxID=2609417 RepID=A0AA97I4B8_9EURY|nr:hypothetical protein [Methanoplanus sp. FWC-SCC4]WOF16349.1 phenylacetate--CoA ligase family protein [Methanoplanus sp. FWC-SCC4]